MLPLSFLLCTYGRTISQCTHNDNYPGDQPSLVSCLILMDSQSCQTWLSQAVLLVTRFLNHSNTDIQVIMGTMDALDMYRCLEILEGCGVGPQARWLLRIYWGKCQWWRGWGGGTTGKRLREIGAWHRVTRFHLPYSMWWWMRWYATRWRWNYKKLRIGERGGMRVGTKLPYFTLITAW